MTGGFSRSFFLISHQVTLSLVAAHQLRMMPRTDFSDTLPHELSLLLAGKRQASR